MSSPAEIIGFIGVGLLLTAFALQSFDRLAPGSRLYQTLNLLGASLAAYASLRISFLPFVLLEGAWAMVAGLALARSFLPTPRR